MFIVTKGKLLTFVHHKEINVTASATKKILSFIL